MHPLPLPDVSQSIRCEAVFADPHWQQKVLKSGKSALKSSIVAAAAAAGGQYKGLKLMEKKKEVDVKMMASTKYTQGLLSRKSLRNSWRDNGPPLTPDYSLQATRSPSPRTAARTPSTSTC